MDKGLETQQVSERILKQITERCKCNVNGDQLYLGHYLHYRTVLSDINMFY